MKNSAARYLYFLHLIVLAVSEDVTGSVNGILTLPCTYTVTKDQHSFCWGRGGCPLWGCNKIIIRTDDNKVTNESSNRYHLLGNISQGDVSLTITGATKKDEGTYCCRVNIPGWFNDLKKEVKVEIEEVAENPIPTEMTHFDSHFTTTRQSMYDTSADHVLYNPVTFTKQRTSFNSQENINSDQSTPPPNTTTYVIAAVVGALFLLALTGVIIYVCKYRHGEKTQSDSPMSVIKRGSSGRDNK